MKIKRHSDIIINAKPSRAIEMFTVIGESLWQDNLDATLFSGNACSKGCVFSVKEAGGHCLYIMMDYEPKSGHILYSQTKPGLTAGTIEFSSVELANQKTKLEIDLELTALSVEGQNELKLLDEHKFDSMTHQWESDVNNYLTLQQETASFQQRM